MSNTAKNYPGTAEDEDIVEVLTAISVVSRRLARCQRQFEIVRKRRRNFVVFRRGG